jgi:hypothetical protein
VGTSRWLGALGWADDAQLILDAAQRSMRLWPESDG